MTEYKVNLPQTAFPMKADLAKREPNWLKYWRDIDLYKKLQLRDVGRKKKFVLHDGPPFANGEIHLGHALNKIFKDMLIKSKMLAGFTAPYVPGWDCHGLPIEINVEKKIGRVGAKISLERFIAECRKYAEGQINLQRDAFIRLGVFGDWSDEKCYKTMNFAYEANIIRALAKIVANGYIERGYKPVHWCTVCGSALAEAEVEYIDKTSPAIDVRFRFVDSEKLLLGVKNISLPIWTTTPWTLPANEAVALHADLEYVLVVCQDMNNEYLLIAKDLLASVMQRYGVKNYQIIKKYFGKNLQGLLLKHPFLAEKNIPVVLGEHVTIDAGTGAVHTAPAHGQEDHRIGLLFGLPIKNPVDGRGHFLPDTPFFANEEVFAANEHILKVLREQGNLIHVETIKHSYPHCWRHKKPLIFRATQQWFISMDKKAGTTGKSLRQQALAAIDEVVWIPAQGKERIKDMLVNRPDWCISRQRFWGTPMALFVAKKTGELHPKILHLMEIVAQNVAKEGIAYWYRLDGKNFLELHAPEYCAEEYEKIDDTLDVWFDSGSSHYAVLQENPELAFPADIYLEGGDQYRGWFQSSLLTALAINGRAPYRQVLAHGMTVDAEGKKMSKSLGNVIAPQKVVGTLGADILRLWVASAYIHDDLAISEEILQRTVDSYRIIRNTARFLLGNLFDFDARKDLLAQEAMLDLDRYMVRKALEWQREVQDKYSEYSFYEACALLIEKISIELSSFYFSIIKDRLYTMAAKSKERRSAQTALWHILEILVRCFAPLTSFTSEEIWQEMKKFAAEREESVFLCRFYDVIKLHDFKSEIDWDFIFEVRKIVNLELEKLRVAGEIGSSLEAEIDLYCDENAYKRLEKLKAKDELRFAFITSAFALYKLPKDFVVEDFVVDAKPLPIFTIEWQKQHNKIAVAARKSLHKKCSRCWHYRQDVGKNEKHPELCSRCLDNLFAAGEVRYYV